MKYEVRGQTLLLEKSLRMGSSRCATILFTGTAANPEPCIHLVFSSCSSTSASESDSQANSRDDSEETSGSPANFLFKRQARRRSTASVETARGRIVELPSSEGEGDGEEAGPAEPPTARKGSASTSPPSGPAQQGDTPETTPDGSSTGAVDGFDATESSGSVAEDIEPDDDIEFEGAGPQANALLRRMYGVGRRWSEDEDGPTIVELDEDGEHAEHVEAMKRLVAEEANNHSKEEGASSARPPPLPRVKRTISQDTLKSKASVDSHAIGKAAVAVNKQREAKLAEQAKRADEEGDEADDEEERKPVEPRRYGPFRTAAVMQTSSTELIFFRLAAPAASVAVASIAARSTSL